MKEEKGIEKLSLKDWLTEADRKFYFGNIMNSLKDYRDVYKLQYDTTLVDYLRSDRYVETKYKEEKSKLALDDSLVYQLDTSGQPRIDKNRIDNNIYEQKFDKIWSLYPNKKGKQAAYKSFIKAIKDGVSPEDIEKGIIQYNTFIKQTKIESQYIKHGSTWFNQRCWEDDYEIKEDDNDEWF